MKSIRKLFLAVLLSVLFLGLAAQGQEKTYKIDLSGKEKGLENMNLSSIASDIDYVVLETIPKSFISSVFRLMKTDNNFLILDHTSMKSERLFIFKLNGSFSSMINKVGKGPGEYSNIDYFTFDPKNQYITILDSGQRKILQFSLSGQFIREVKIDGRLSEICFIEPGYFVATIPLRFVKPTGDGMLYNIIIYDRDLKVKKRIASSSKSLEHPNSPFEVSGDLRTFENQLRYKQPFVDDIFTLNQNLEYHVFCKIDFGTYRLPESVFASSEKYKSNRDNYKEFASIIESRNSFFVRYLYNGMTCTYLCNKSNGSMTNLSGKQENFGITNDFDGSIPFWPDYSSGTDELIRAYNAIDFMELCEQNHVKKFKSKFPMQQKKLLNALGKLDENSNPVIQVVTLKNN